MWSLARLVRALPPTLTRGSTNPFPFSFPSPALSLAFLLLFPPTLSSFVSAGSSAGYTPSMISMRDNEYRNDDPRSRGLGPAASIYSGFAFDPSLLAFISSLMI